MIGEPVQDALLVLADGAEFEGEWVGPVPDGEPITTGEVVFNTALTGYQEVISDPSYAGQIIAFTYPHIGNYGVTESDSEATRPHCRGVLVRDIPPRPSSWRADGDLGGFLEAHRVPAMTGLDTRRLTRHLRHHGALPGAFGPVGAEHGAREIRDAAAAASPTDGMDLVATVTTGSPYEVGDPSAPHFVVAFDFGIKRSILDRLVGSGCRVEVVPASTTAADVLARAPSGVFLSNGPGDPEAVSGAVDTVASLVGEVPIFGICLGHQILGLALGATKAKLPFGHHGGNHPLEEVATGRVHITSQNHNYAVDPGPAGDRLVVTYRNLNDGVCEGFRVADARAFGVQHHPEAGPGPHDTLHLFDEFAALMGERHGVRT